MTTSQEPKCNKHDATLPCVTCDTDRIMEERAEKERATAISLSLGGWRAYDVYTEERFTETTINAAAFEFCKAFDPKKENVYLFGPAGTGKSHLATIAARRHIKTKPNPRGYDGFITNVSHVKPPQLFREVRGAGDASREVAIIEDYAYSQVLIIDDIGIGKETEFANTTLFEIIDGRYMNRPGGLIVTSNLSLGDLATKLGDDRIPSRLAEMCKVFSLAGEIDRRVKQHDNSGSTQSGNQRPHSKA